MNTINNIFGFSYETTNLTNKNGTPSNFWKVYGEGGNLMHCKKNSYTLVDTEDVSAIAQGFIDKGYNVIPFTHRNGEKIGFTVALGKRMTKVGDKQYQIVVTIPNNGGGKGYFTIQEVRLICGNGWTRKNSSITGGVRIPHKADYNDYLKVMELAIQDSVAMIKSIEANDEKLDAEVLSRTEAKYQLNEWFYNNEMPSNHKKNMDFNQFREMLYSNPAEIKSIDRYQELMEAFDAELGYNEELDLKLSRYTVLATCTNYLSRRIEKSQSKASEVIQYERQADKLKAFVAA